MLQILREITIKLQSKAIDVVVSAYKLVSKVVPRLKSLRSNSISELSKQFAEVTRLGTRWVERIDSYAVFLELLPALHLCLEAMVHPELHQQLGTNWSWDGETITKAVSATVISVLGGFSDPATGAGAPDT